MDTKDNKVDEKLQDDKLNEDEEIEFEAEIVDDDGQVVEEIEEDNEYKDKYQRLLADFQNYKQREEKAKVEFKKYANNNLLEKLLPVLDNFDRALVDKDQEDPFVKGIIMTRDELIRVLEKEGLKEIKSDGEKFDHNLHHAVMAEENEDYEEDMIIETFQKGYMINDKVLRPAMVKVSK